jgi:hypothetical protein
MSQQTVKLLTSYVDGELSDKEKNQLEKELSEHPEYGEEVERLRRVKQITTSKKQVEESPFFWTQLEARINEKESRSFIEEFIPVPRRLIPVAVTFIVVSVVVLVLMFTRDKSMEQYVGSKVEAVKDIYEKSFLSGNIAPLFGEVTKEDVFQFAIGGILPVSTANAQVLHFGDQPSQGYWVEVGSKPPDQLPKHSLNSFYRQVNLRPEQSALVDSILEGYGDEIEKSVLVSGDRFMAIKADVWSMNKALVLNIASNLDHAQRTRMTAYLGTYNPLRVDLNEIDFAAADTIMRRHHWSVPRGKKEFVIIGPDSICIKSFSFDPESIVVARKRSWTWPDSLMRVEMAKVQVYQDSLQRHVKVMVDSLRVIEKPWPTQKTSYKKTGKSHDSLQRAVLQKLWVQQDSMQHYLKIVIDSLVPPEKLLSFQDDFVRKQWRWQDSIQRTQMKALRIYQDKMEHHITIMMDSLKHHQMEFDSKIFRVFPDSLKCRIEIGGRFQTGLFDSVTVVFANPPRSVPPHKVVVPMPRMPAVPRPPKNKEFRFDFSDSVWMRKFAFPDSSHIKMFLPDSGTMMYNRLTPDSLSSIFRRLKPLGLNEIMRFKLDSLQSMYDSLMRKGTMNSRTADSLYRKFFEESFKKRYDEIRKEKKKKQVEI